MKRIFLSLLFNSVLLQPVLPAVIEGEYSTLQVVAENDRYIPGEKLRVGFHFTMRNNWHSYYLNPGDSGSPLLVDFDMPEKWQVDRIIWPNPERISTPPLMTYGYHDKFMVIYVLDIPATAAAEAVISADINYLECRDICLPVEGSISLKLKKFTGSKKTVRSQLFKENEGSYPLMTQQLQWNSERSGRMLLLSVELPPATDTPEPENAYFFPDDSMLIQHAAEQKFSINNNSLSLQIPLSENVPKNSKLNKGLLHLKTDASKKYYRLTGLNYSEPGGITPVVLYALMAFIGGLLLNLMPCVLPVLFLKISALITNPQKDRKQRLSDALLYTAGIMVSFYILTLILLLVRSGGRSIGWGFQLQSPEFIGVLSVFLSIFALQMLGFGTNLISFTGSGRSHNAFITGILAVIVASPCTAPFMGAAVGFSLTADTATTLIIFTMLGLGLAFPFLMIGLMPSAAKILPKPGSWMNRFKEAAGFMLFATVIWLLWVLSSQAGSPAVLAVLGSILTAAIALWVDTTGSGIHSSKLSRKFSRITALILLLAALSAAALLVQPVEKPARVSSQTEQWQNFTTEKLSRLLAAEKRVFIDFTADWCLSCKVNERIAFTDKVFKTFSEKKFVLLKADFTDYSNEIALFLEKYGRAGVPFYILYNRSAENYYTLPEILTEQTVLDYIEKIKEEPEK